MNKVYEHDFNSAGICNKCHTHKMSIINLLCPVIGKEEVKTFRNEDDNAWK